MATMSISDALRVLGARLKGVQPASLHVSGEVSSVATPSSGHIYFDLKDATSSAKCVLWRSSLPVSELYVGAVVHATVLPRIYQARGELSLDVRSLRVVEDVGAHARARRQFVDRLRAEGSLTRARRPIGLIPRHVCIITSLGSAALADMESSLRMRWPNLRTTLIDASTQGEGAVDTLVRAFHAAKQLQPPPSVVVCGRGGGSREDLRVFDDERIVRCMLACHALFPIVCAVGHETDHSVCDMIVDVRAKTPTEAIEMAVPLEQNHVKARLRELRGELQRLGAATHESARKGCSRHRDAIDRAVSRAIAREGDVLHKTRVDLEQAPRVGFTHRAHVMSCMRSNLEGIVRRVVCEARRALPHATGVRAIVRQSVQKRRGRQAELRCALLRATKARIAGARRDASAMRVNLRAVHPNHILERGFSIVRWARSSVDSPGAEGVLHGIPPLGARLAIETAAGLFHARVVE